MRTVTRNRVVIDTDNAIDEANVARVKRVKDEDFEQARQKELQSFKDTGTYVEVPYEGQHVISSRWVHTLKLLDDGSTKAKARLVARGFEDPELGSLLTASPTCGRGMYRLAVQLCANREWVPSCIEIHGSCSGWRH